MTSREWLIEYIYLCAIFGNFRKLFSFVTYNKIGRMGVVLRARRGVGLLFTGAEVAHDGTGRLNLRCVS